MTPGFTTSTFSFKEQSSNETIPLSDWLSCPKLGPFLERFLPGGPRSEAARCACLVGVACLQQYEAGTEGVEVTLETLLELASGLSTPSRFGLRNHRSYSAAIHQTDALAEEARIPMSARSVSPHQQAIPSSPSQANRWRYSGGSRGSLGSQASLERSKRVGSSTFAQRPPSPGHATKSQVIESAAATAAAAVAAAAAAAAQAAVSTSREVVHTSFSAPPPANSVNFSQSSLSMHGIHHMNSAVAVTSLPPQHPHPQQPPQLPHTHTPIGVGTAISWPSSAATPAPGTYVGPVYLRRPGVAAGGAAAAIPATPRQTLRSPLPAQVAPTRIAVCSPAPFTPRVVQTFVAAKC
eukprot:CAMPEP_0206631080 /NCGR_PEP_ID=MMETSP0325_2-20121206/67938_1 /ASSEMBLY_ACC=CAM_ASM_000347 /TAXON_ID=2866 /ORGANISM="Crypthecodinium cohnii, Strain Seligo" /LENGTH=350 /DNA_ID=CAMNT_0054156027 /DNA_START=106 /DNA_END=1155 /DNA_ORIENTATION=-